MSTQVDSTPDRLMVLRQLIREGSAGTQEELCKALAEKSVEVTQSTVSRDLRRIGAVKVTNAQGEVIYKLPEDAPVLPTAVTLEGLLNTIEFNENMIVLHSTPGSASLVAHKIDDLRETLGIIGTIAGDDTIFVVPASVKKIPVVIRKIKEEFY